AGFGGSDRVTLIWEDGAIRNEWLKVTVRADATTGLLADDVFAFGNLAGETGDPTFRNVMSVTAADLSAVRRAAGSRAAIDDVEDINRDGRVDGRDLAAVRSNLFHVLRPIVAFGPPAPVPAPA